ncbi:ATP-binding protein [Rhizobium deserti]|nr:ATP-binding protein [Rhizobium deserti]
MNDDELSQFRARVRSHVIPNDRDAPLKSQVRDLIDNVNDIRNGGGSRRRSLFVIGESGSGKSFSLRNIFATTPEFQAYPDEHGRTMRPLISVEAPRPCGIVDLCNEVLKKLGLPQNHSMKPAFARETLRTILREHGVIYLHVDEAQHMLRHPTEHAVRVMQDQLKVLVQTQEWPLHVIFSGVLDLDRLLQTDDFQLGNRSDVRRFGELTWPGDRKIVERILTEVACDQCGLALDKKMLEDEVHGRIWKASLKEFGTSIETVQGASFLAVKNGHPVLGSAHFARYYERHYGCLPVDNMFLAKTWLDIDPKKARADIALAFKKKRN